MPVCWNSRSCPSPIIGVILSPGFSDCRLNQIVLVGAVGLELVGQPLSLADSTALAPLHPSKTLLMYPVLDTSWPRV